MNKTFENLNLNDKLINALEKQGITSPTDIQINAIGDTLINKDIIAESHTGSGKTLAYLLPIFEKVNTEKREMQVIILTPTHELAFQVNDQIKLLSKNSEINVTSLPIIGDVNINNQIEKLKKIKPHILVGSQGRILDLITKRKITAHTIKTIVIDECDYLLDSKREDITKKIIKSAMKDCQILAYSASIKDKTLTILKGIMKNPVIIKNSSNNEINPNIKHVLFVCDRRDKFDTLRKIISAENPKKSIVFINDANDLDVITSKLNYHKKSAFALSSHISKEDRQLALESFRSGKINILVSTDLGARGLDIDDITHIFHLDLPLKLNEYLHRSGRTARMNKTGYSVAICSEKQINIISKYEKEFNIKFEAKKIYDGKIYDVNQDVKKVLLQNNNKFLKPKKDDKKIKNKKSNKKKFN